MNVILLDLVPRLMDYYYTLLILMEHIDLPIA